MNELGVIIPTHRGHEKIIPKCIESCRAFNPKWIVLVQDFLEGISLPREVLDLSDKVIFQEIGGGPSKPWIYQQKAGVSFLKEKGIEYIFSLNGDCVIEKPENFLFLYEKFVDSGADLMSSVYKLTFKGALTLSTMSLMAKTESMDEILDIMISDFGNWIKFASGKRLLHAAGKGNYNILEIENPEHYNFTLEFNPNRKGVWMNDIGFVHLHEEWFGVRRK